MSEEFFARLRERVDAKIDALERRYEMPAWRKDCIKATIEALKEMMVGEPINTNVRVRKEPLFIWDEERGDYVPLLKEGRQREGIYGYINLFDITVKDYPGIDGEGLVVMVFKKP